MANLIKFKNINSTNKYALANINEIGDKSVVIAETQDAGRGRFSRKWISDKKDNCYISFVLKPDITHRENFPNLTQYLSVVLCEELAQYNVLPNIKWPNDVQINGKKISGILSETAFDGQDFLGIVLGIGVNLNLGQSDLNSIDIPATALNIETGEKIDSNKFIESLIERFFSGYDNIIENGFSVIRAKYISYCNFLGKEITIKNPEPVTLGTALSVNKNGSLEILTPQGEKQIILSGDVIIR